MIHLKVPHLHDREIEESAAGLLSAFAVSSKKESRPPIDIERIVEHHLNLVFEITDLKAKLAQPDVLGAAWFEEGRVAVDSSIEHEEGRLAFTLGHEAGHWVLHRPLYEEQKRLLQLVPSPSAPAVVCREQEKRSNIEWQANQFASRVLMPAMFVRQAVTAAFGTATPTWAGLRSKFRRDEYDPELKKVAAAVILEGGFTNISNEAMRRRLVELKLVQDAAEVQYSLFQ